MTTREPSRSSFTPALGRNRDRNGPALPELQRHRRFGHDAGNSAASPEGRAAIAAAKAAAAQDQATAAANQNQPKHH